MSSQTAILQLKDISYSIGSTKLFSELNISISKGERLCIVGRNGSGKTTLMKLMLQIIEPDDGEIFLQPGTKITYMPQEPTIPNGMTVLEYICSNDIDEDSNFNNNQSTSSNTDIKQHEAKMLLDEMKIAYEALTDNLSGGEERKISLIRALIRNPDILMLDEPTNHLDITAIQWLERCINTFSGAVIVISHDKTFLTNTTKATLWLDRRKILRLNKSYKYFDEWSEKIIEEECKAQIKLDKLIEQETKWSHGGISARRKRNQGRLKRLYEMRQKRSNQLKHIKMARLEASMAEESSKCVIEAKNITKSYGEKIIITNFSTRITSGEKIGIIGPNGSGKTTLLRMLIGEIRADSGKIRIAKNLDKVYMDQKRSILNSKKTMWEIMCPNGGDFISTQGKTRHVVAYLKDFMFTPDQVRGPVNVLSGGEKNRFLLALSLATPSNLLVLDEPTNDLDMDTLDRLQEMLFNYEGTIIMVTHDRSFLDNVVTSTIVLEGDGSAIEYAGGYSDYLKQVTINQSKNKEKIHGLDSKEQKQKNTNNKETTSNNKTTTAKPIKMSYKDQFALQQLPKQIENIEKKIKELETKLYDPNIYQQEPELAAEIAEELKVLQIKKTEAEEKWLELEMLAEEINRNIK